MLDDSTESYESMKTAPQSPLTSAQTSPEKAAPLNPEMTMTPGTAALIASMEELVVKDGASLEEESATSNPPLPTSPTVVPVEPRFHSTPLTKGPPINSGTIVRRGAPPLQHSSSTESASGKEESPRKRHERQKTMTVVNQGAQEVQRVINEVRALDGEADLIGELERRMIQLISSRDRESAAKHDKLGQMLVAAKQELVAAQDELLASKELFEVTERFWKAAATDNFTQAQSLARSRSVSSDIQQQTSSPQRPTQNGGEPSLALRAIERERDHLREEVDRMHAQYASLYTTYDKQRAAIEQLKGALQEVSLDRDATLSKLNELEENFTRLRGRAEAELERANEMVHQLKKEHEENSVATRARLRQKETEVEAKTKELELKNAQINELNSIVQTLIRQAEETGDDTSLNGDFE